MNLLTNAYSLLLILASLVALVENPGTNGAAKKASAIEQAETALAKNNLLPSWLPKQAVDLILSTLIDVLVGWANKSGFFSASATK